MNRATAAFPDYATNVNWIPCLGLLTGTFLLLVSIGASGWIASRRLARVSSGVAVIGAVALLAIFGWFAEVG